MDQLTHGVLRFDRFALDLTRGFLRADDSWRQELDLERTCRVLVVGVTRWLALASSAELHHVSG